MAHYLAVLDRDAARRESLTREARRHLGSFNGLAVNGTTKGALTVVWATSPNAPLSISDSGGFAVLIGEPIPGPGSARATAGTIVKDWLQGPLDRVPEAYSGFYLAVVADQDGRVLVGADVLGLFPVYYWASNGVLLVGSSPELFRYHPLFRLAISAEGLAGILLSNGLAGGRALLEEVHRLAPGHLLVALPEQPPSEVTQYALVRSDRYYDLSIGALVDVLEESMDAAIRRCAPTDEHLMLMLSGGMDSRTLAGLLHRQGTPVLAQTLGVSGDIESRCATRVAKALEFKHRIVAESEGDPVAGLSETVRWEHLANGLFGTSGPFHPVTGDQPARTMAGYLIDVLIESLRADRFPGDPFDGMFEHWFQRMNRWGIPPAEVGRLLGDDDLPAICIARMREEFRSASDSPPWARRAMTLRTVGRYRVGVMAWRHSFWSWPAFPALDKELIETINGMPMAALGERHIEEELLCRKFPKLAALPLDQNSFDSTPLRPRLRYLTAQFVLRRLGLRRDPPVRRMPRVGERRYFYRMSDFNGPRWNTIRAEAEPLRGVLDGVVSREVVDRLWPPAGQVVSPEFPMMGTSGAKLLIGLMFWAREHL